MIQNGPRQLGSHISGTIEVSVQSYGQSVAFLHNNPPKTVNPNILLGPLNSQTRGHMFNRYTVVDENYDSTYQMDHAYQLWTHCTAFAAVKKVP